MLRWRISFVVVASMLLFINFSFSQENQINTNRNEDNKVQDAPKSKTNLQDILNNVEAQRTIVLDELNKININVQNETKRIMDVVDVTLTVEMNPIFSKHYEETEKVLNTITLPENTGGFDLVWQQVKATVSNDDGLKQICEPFIKNAQEKLKDDQSKIFSVLEEKLNNTLKSEIEISTRNIREPFNKAIIKEFPAWTKAQNISFPQPKSPEVNGNAPINGGTRETFTRGATIVYILALTLRKIVNAIAVRMGKKIAGKMLSKLIPGIGLVLLAFDIIDIASAKTKMETELRKIFLEQYKQEFTFNKIWIDKSNGEQSFQEQVRAQIAQQLENYSKMCREESQRVLNASKVLAISPKVGEYIENESKNDTNTEILVNNLTRVGDAFEEKIIAGEPVKTLLNILSESGDVKLTR